MVSTISISSSSAAAAVPVYLHLMVFVILILGTALFLGGTAAILGYRNRLLAASSDPSRTHVTSPADLEKGNTTQSGPTCEDDLESRTGLIRSFLRWRRRVLYESDSVPELALLPSYKPKETIKRKILNFLLRKKRIIPDPPTIVTITRVIEAAEARERAAAAAAVAPGVVVAKADVPAPPIQLPASPPPSFQIPAIVVQCWDTPVDHCPLANPILPPSCSTASSYSSASTMSSTSGCRTPPESLSCSGSSLALSPAVASPAAFFFPGFAPSASMSSFDYLHVPPPSWGGQVHGHIADPVLADLSNVSGARFVLGPAPPPRALLRSKAKATSLGVVAYSPPLACVALATSAPLKTVEGERRVKRVTTRSARSAAGGMPRTPQEGVVGIVSANGGVPLGPLPDIPASGGLEAVATGSRSVPRSADRSDDPRHSKRPALNKEEETERTNGTLRATPEKHARTSRADPDVTAILEQILSSSSTASSLVDLILEAIAAETDESFHYTTVSSSFSSSPSTSSAASSSSSSSRHSTASTASTVSSRSGAFWAEDEDEEGDVGTRTDDRDAHRSFLILEDESEEDFLDSVLSAYIRDDGDNYSLNLSSGSDYGEFDDIDLCGDRASCGPTSGKPDANVKGLIPPRKKFLSPVRVVHPGFAI